MSLIYLGIDVHKNSFNICALSQNTGEILGEIHCDGDAKSVQKFTRSLQKNTADNLEFKAGYEAGVRGYALHSELETMGISCDILAPTTMFKAIKNQAVKNDKLDAKMIASNLAHQTYKAVYIPTQEDQDVKTYIRMRNSEVAALKSLKSQVSLFLLGQGYTFSGTNWTQAYMRWVKNLELRPILRQTLDAYLIRYDRLINDIDDHNAEIARMSQFPKYAEPVAQLKCFKGIDTMAAMTIQTEIEDFSRFPNAQAISSYVGLTPRQNSSGDKTHLGSITKGGNKRVRTQLIETAQCLVRGEIGHISQRVHARQKGQAAEVINYANKGVARLQKKYRRMTNGAHPKPKGVAITAVARELICFIWGMETGRRDPYIKI